MKLRKSLVKPVTRQNIWSCLVLPHEIVEHEAFNIILWTSADICVIVRDDLGWKNQTTRYNCRFSAASLALPVILVRRKRPPIYASCMTISVMGGKKEIYRDVRFFHGAIQLYAIHRTCLHFRTNSSWFIWISYLTVSWFVGILYHS